MSARGAVFSLGHRAEECICEARAAKHARMIVDGESTPKNASACHRVSVQDDYLAVLCLAARGLAVLQGA